MTAAHYDVLVIGAGIIGAACAFECAKERLSVAVIEPDIPGGGATAAGMGHLVVMDDSEAQFAFTRYSLQLWRELASDLPLDCEYSATGTLWVAADEDEMAEVHRKGAYYGARQISAEVLDDQSLSQAQPNLRRGLAGGLLVGQDAVVYPTAVARYLLKRSQATLISGQRVIRLDDSGATLEDGATLHANVYINAAGSQAAAITPGLPVVPRKGHLMITDRYPFFVLHQLIELGYLKNAHKSAADSVAFNVQPRKTGQLLIGSSRQYGSYHPAIDTDIMSRMLSRAFDYMPALKQLSGIRGWTGFRAATPDHLPLIGLCEGYRCVYAASGHEGLGITTSLGTARLLVDELLKRESFIPRDPYQAARTFAPHA